MDKTKIFVMVNGETRSLQWLCDNSEKATRVRFSNLPGVTELPPLPAATRVWFSNLPGVTVGFLGKARGNDDNIYSAFCAKLRGQWFIVAGCRTLSISDARAHWRNNVAALALVEKAADFVAAQGQREAA